MIRVGSPAGTATNSSSRPCRSAPITRSRSCPAYSYSTSRMALRHAWSMSASVIPCLRGQVMVRAGKVVCFVRGVECRAPVLG